MSKLKRSKDRKVANSLTSSGAVRIANSFGLPAGRDYSCPGATSVCERVCYAGKLERLYKGVKEALVHNWDLIKDAQFDDMVDMLDEMIIEFEAECSKWEAPREFRIHWDGDFFSLTYTEAWATVIKRHPDVRFWVYTRVEESAQWLKGIPNLTLYFSGDADNIQAAQRVQAAGIPVAMLADTFALARESVGRGAMCPEQRGQIALTGACVACGICLKGQTNVLFSIKKR